MKTPELTAALSRLQQALVTTTTIDIPGLVQRLYSGTASEQEWTSSAEHLLRVDAVMATNLLEAATGHMPESAQLHYLLGNARRMCAKRSDAEVSLRRAIALDPAHASASLSLAYLLREQGHLSALAEVMLALWHNERRSLESDKRTLDFLCECERFAEADSLAAPILAAHPDEPSLLGRAGQIALVLGRFDEARRLLRKALAINPHLASAWLRLAHTHRFTQHDDPDLVLLREGAARSDLTEDVDTAIGFGLGKALDDLAEIADAAEVLRRANARWHASHPWDAAAWRQFVTARLASPALTATTHADDAVPVFIVGLPRSGTTLAASLLARDASIRNRGELNWIPALVARLGPSPGVEMLAGAGRYFMTQLRQDDTPARFYIDKNPLNFRYLDLIAAMLPQARIIHCRRDLRDTALSIWSQHFAHDDMAWTYDLGDIAGFTHGYQQLMARWQAAMPQRIFELDYEALVTDNEATLARARQFLGLGPRVAVAESGSNLTEVIATASVWQARQEVHTRSVSRWQRYLDYLPELNQLSPG